jgi:hypothetical protein
VLWCGGNEQHPASDLDAGLRSMLDPNKQHSGCELHQLKAKDTPALVWGGCDGDTQPSLPLLDWTRPYVKVATATQKHFSADLHVFWYPYAVLSGDRVWLIRVVLLWKGKHLYVCSRETFDELLVSKYLEGPVTFEVSLAVFSWQGMLQWWQGVAIYGRRCNFAQLEIPHFIAQILLFNKKPLN